MWTRQDLLASLRDVGLLRNPDVEQAVRDVDQAAFLPEGFACLAYADMPMPVHGDLRGRPPRVPAAPRARAGFADVRGVGFPPGGTFDRVLVLAPAVPRPRDLVG